MLRTPPNSAKSRHNLDHFVLGVKFEMTAKVHVEMWKPM